MDRDQDPDAAAPGEPAPDDHGPDGIALEPSIYGHTDTVFTVPKFNQGVPRDPAFIRILSAVEIAVAVALFALLFGGVMYQVVSRYVPAIAWVGAGELALLSMVALTFITAGYLVGRNGHIVIEVFDQLLAGKRLFAILRIVSAVIMTLTCLALAYEAFIKVDGEWARASAAMHIPLGMLYVFAFVGFLSGAVHSVMKIPYAGRPERQLDITEMEV